MAFLEAQDCSLSFGGLKAVSRFNFALDPGELVGLIGPNGAGKTTVFNLITGVYAPDAGDIRLGNARIAGLAPFQINRRGIARTFQGIRLFANLTAFENVMVGYNRHPHHQLLGTMLGTRGAQAERSRIEAECRKLLQMVGLESQLDAPARSLPYGSQRRLEIARALATRPKLLLLDEPAAGTNPQEKVELMEKIRWLRDDLGLGILIIEHDMPLIMQICERITVLDHGETIAVGPPEVIRRDPKVIEAYLGEQAGG
ncbi:MAG: ABC transporter ATP-binding protein [Deltaproteobacteria bacterium]|nr:ABC transporter ATP-binding protein [Deltaproteobacteria bacterium]